MRLDTVVMNAYNNTPQKYRVTFFATIILGLCAHLYQFTNKLFNYDELGHTPKGFGSGISLGRWGLELLGDVTDKFFGTYSLPFLNGLLTLFMIAISACFIVSALDIKDYVFCALIGGICAVFPTITCTYFFMYTAPYYGMALLLSTLSGYLVIRKRGIISYLCAILALTFATGIYQAYYPVAVCLVMINMAVLAYYDEWNAKDIIKRGLFYVSFLLLGLVLYLLINQLAVRFSGVHLSEYQNIGQMSSITISDIGKGIIRCYSSYFSMMLTRDVYQLNPTIFTKISFLLLNMSVFVITILNLMNRQKDRINRFMFTATIAVFPVGVFLIYLMAPNSYVYSLMLYPCLFVFLLPITLCNHMMSQNSVGGGTTATTSMIRQLITWTSALFTTICIFIYVWFANGNYQALQYTNYHDLAYYTVMMSQVKGLDGFHQEMPVVFVGTEIRDITNQAGSLVDERFNLSGKVQSNIGTYANGNIIGQYLGFTPATLPWEEIERLSETKEIKEMPCYPEDGSIKIVNENIIVKLANN